MWLYWSLRYLLSLHACFDICYIEMDFECFRWVLWSTWKPNLKGLRIVHALNITRTRENHEEFVSDRASCWHGNSQGNVYPWHKKNVNLRHYLFLRQFGAFCCNRFALLFFYANVTVLMVRMKDDRFLQVVAEHVTIIWPVLLWSLDDLFRWKHTTTSYFKECFSN